MELSAYENYKSTGSIWLGDVPSHWVVKAIKWESPVFRGASPRPIDDPIYFDDAGEYAWVRISDVTEAGTYLETTEQFLSDTGSAQSVKLEPDSLFLSIAGSVGKPCITKIKCCIHDGFVYFPKWKGDFKFLYYIFASGEPYKGLGKMGTQLNLNTDTVGSIIIGLPDEIEQQAITRFLDAKTAQIDALVTKKRQLIIKLKEKRSALIAQTVTRGLPPEAAKASGIEPNPEMKDSGVEWIGEIPSNWNVKRLKYIANRAEIKVEASEENPIPYIGLEHIEQWMGRLLPLNEDLVPTGISNKFEAGDTLFNKLRPYLAKGCNVDFQGLCSSELLVLRGNSYDRSFLLYQLLSHGFINLVDSSTYGSKMPRASWDFISVCKLTLPTISEQQAISAYIHNETNKIDLLLSKVETAISRLIEYRQSLITSAVTGKIDVRGFTA
jgi:type I restriction enzyme S subunit